MTKEDLYNDMIAKAMELQDACKFKEAKELVDKVKLFKERDGAKFAYVTGDACESCT